ncbi:MAG: class I SAM-dependent methyltransferase [Acidimicrobiales bacterium]
MDELELLVELHLGGQRQGPGSDEATRRAIALSGLEQRTELRIADLGCGTGASTLVLAQDLDADITAVDLFPGFLARLAARAAERGLADRVTTVTASIDELGFDDESLDVIWSEGAVYNIGFAHGVSAWRRFLRPGGVLAVSEFTWLTHDRPAELTDHWVGEYPEVATASAKIAILEAAGYSPIGYFALAEDCWLEHYYRPLQARFEAFLDHQDRSPAALEVVEAEQQEIELYERFSAFFGYGFYLARRTTG